MPLIASQIKPRVILGLMTFGPDEKTGARITDINEFKDILDTFQTRGYNEVDTARVYVGTKQEAFTREAGWLKRGLALATKIHYPAQNGANTYEKVLESAAASLKELDTKTVDILYLHAADRGTPFEETLRAIDKLHKEGKFVTFGISNFTAFEVAEIMMICKYNNFVRPTIYQARYNIISRDIEAELIPALRRYGLDIVVYNPIAGGLFSGKVKSADVMPSEGRFSDNANNGAAYRERYFRESTFNALKLVEGAAAKHNLSVIEVALRWIVHHSALKVLNGDDGIILGVSRKEQLIQNLDNLEKGPLPEDILADLDKAWFVSKQNVANYWHKDLAYEYDTVKTLFGTK